MGGEPVRGVADPAAFAERRAQIVNLTALEFTAAEIAARLGITPRTVTRARRAAGIAQQKPPPMSDDEKRAAQRLLDDGASYHDVANTLGRAADTIKRNLPGYTWDRGRCAEAAALGRVMARLERQGSFAVAAGNPRARNTKGNNAA